MASVSNQTKKIKRKLFMRGAKIVDGSWKSRCHYCGNWFQLRHLTRDHVLRKRDGGLNGIQNSVLACRLCNWAREGAVTMQEVLRHRQILGVQG